MPNAPHVSGTPESVIFWYMLNYLFVTARFRILGKHMYLFDPRQIPKSIVSMRILGACMLRETEGGLGC